MPRLAVAARTHTGNMRAHNEDAYVIGCNAVAQVDSASWEAVIDVAAPVLLGVADGIGGHKAGGLASQLAAQHLASAPLTSREHLEQSLRAIDYELLARGEAPETFRLGTTFCGILFGVSPVAVSVGDGFIAMRVGRALRPFGMTWQDVAQTSRLQTALGGREPSVSLMLQWHDVPLLGTARYVVATDGIIRALRYDRFATTLRDAQSPSACLTELFTQALNTQAPDNLTCIVAEVLNET